MAHEQSDVYETQLAHALGLASFTLGKTGDHSVALSAARESVAIWRQLVEEQPRKHDHYLASALHVLCFALQDAGRGDETLAPAEESVRITRCLRARGSGAAYARLLANGLDLQVAALGNRERSKNSSSGVTEARSAIASICPRRGVAMRRWCRTGPPRNSLQLGTTAYPVHPESV